MTFEEVVRLHKKVFGVAPKTTGASFWRREPLADLILEAIDAGIPYVEGPVSDDKDI